MLKLTLRNKILTSYGVLFVVFITLMHFIASHTVKMVVVESMEERTTHLIKEIQSQNAPDDVELVRYLKDLKSVIFFRVSIINDQREILYDSHTKRLLGSEFNTEYVVQHPEVIQAMKEGTGYQEEYSAILGQEFAYFAKAFRFHGKTYVMRTAYPLNYINSVVSKFKTTFLLFAFGISLIFGLMIWVITKRLTSPIGQIITAIRPYQEGRASSIPEIRLKSHYEGDEIEQLAGTLNSLSQKVQKHIDTLTIERNEKSTILESLTEGVLAVDHDLRIEYANRAAAYFYSIAVQDIVGSKLDAEYYPTSYELSIKCIQEGRAQTAPLKVKHEGKTVFLDIIAIPKESGSGAIVVMQDKTEMYRMLEMRSQFVANASHELKTPITIIGGFAEAIHDHPGLEPERLKEITAKIVNNCERLTVMIKDLLTLCDVENLPAYRLSHCFLDDLMANYREHLLERFPNASVKIESKVNYPIELTLDAELFQVAIVNLLENAAKYSNPPAQISVVMNVRDGKAVLEIADKGIGIPKADLEHIFERFYTVNKAHSKKMGGSGLGLSIVETIIEKHKGKISVDSEVGVGTRFTIELPLNLEELIGQGTSS